MLLRDRPLIGILVLAAVLRLAWAVLAPSFDPFLRFDELPSDAGDYHRLALHIIAGEGFTVNGSQPDIFRPPLYSFFLAGIYSVFGPNILLVRIVQAILGVVAVFLLYKFSAMLFPPAHALLAAFMLAINPMVIYFCTWVVSEAIFVPMFMLMLMLALSLGRQPSWRTALALGVLTGLTSLARPVTVFFVPLFVLWLLARRWPQGPRHAATYAAVVAAAVALTIAPWTARNFLHTRELIPISTNGGYVFAGANNAEAFGGQREGSPGPIRGLTPGQLEKEYYRLGIEWIMEHPSDWLVLALKKLDRLTSPLSVASFEEPMPVPFSAVIHISYRLILALALIGMITAGFSSRERWLLLIPVLGTVYSTIIYYGATRYFIPMMPSMLIFLAIALFKLRDLGRRFSPLRSPA